MNLLRNTWIPFHQRITMCDVSLQTMMDIVHRGNLLNQRQCEDLTTKLTLINENIHLIVKRNRLLKQFSFRDYYQCLEKAKMLITNCGEKKWWRVAAFQWQNENAFQEILLDASLCYNAIYENAKEKKETGFPNDLRQSLVFEPASDEVVREDEEHLISLLGKLINDHGAIESEHLSCPEELARARALAKFLTNRFASNQSVINNKKEDTGIGIMWDEDMEYPGVWGEVCNLKGTGSEFVKAVSTEWLGIPCVRKEFLADEDEKVFLKEASIMAHMKHPNIIRFLCHGNDQNPKCRFIGMELMEMSLSKLIELQAGKPFPMDVAIHIIKQIARGMCYLHDQDVAHRDLKPQNVVIKKWGSPDFEGHCDVKLVDFGISKTEVDDSKSSTITFYGIGTTKYRAPELHPSAKLYSRDRAKWFKADVYSFAMTCVHVLSLQTPFEDLEGKYSHEEFYIKILEGTRPRLPKSCPISLEELLKNCWHILPYRRPTFVQICAKLEIDQRQGLEWMFLGRDNSKVDFAIKKIAAQSAHYKSLPKVILGEANDKDSNNLVAITSCTCNHNLTYLQKPAYAGELARCNICGDGGIDGEVYHCSTCQFDAHPYCAEIRERIHVFHHAHPLQLLIRNFYKNDPRAICSLCEESIQISEWVYQCEQCEYDVHVHCTKFLNHRRGLEHKHSLTMRLCPPRKSLLCERCNGEIQGRTWHFYCRPCAFSMHLSCVIRPTNPLCLFDNSYRLILEIVPRIFVCALCDIQGYSQVYHCKHCNKDMHPHCVDYMYDETWKWNEAYEKVMMERESKDVQAQTILISEILDKMSSYYEFGGKSSTYKPPLAVKKMQVPIHKSTAPKHNLDSLDLVNDVYLQRNIISVQTAKCIKAKKLSSEKLRENPLGMLENLEKIVSNLQTLENISIDEKKYLMVIHERLKERQQLVKEEKAIQEESKMCLGPRIGVFFKKVVKDERVVRQLLIDLQVDMKEVWCNLLCEKSGHEHIVPDRSTRVSMFKLGEELAENLEPLLACGLQIVKNNITCIEDDLVGLKFISLPALDGDKLWDLSAINKIKGMENMEVLKQAAFSSSEWFLKWNEVRGSNIEEAFGLHRIRYKVIDGGNFPCYKSGSVAWLCKDHFDDGVKEGILESHSF